MEIGQQIGPYRIESLLGRGGMAEVYKVHHGGLSRPEALKALPAQMTLDKTFVERFLNEARTAANLQHPNIAAIYSVSEADAPQPYFTMELVESGDLSDVIAARAPMSLDEALPIVQQIASALDYAHTQGFIHRDIKPGNILVKPNGRGGWDAKVVDFGIARAREDAGGTRLTKTGMIIGTPEYMSPEQGGSGAKVGPATDQYALGIIAYEMLCGVPPFKAESDTGPISLIMQHVRDEPRAPVAHNPELSKATNNAILKALAKDPEERFASCGEFASALAGEFTVKAPSTPTRASTTVGRKMPSVPVALLGLVLLGGAALLGYGLSNRSSQFGQQTFSLPADVPSLPIQETPDAKPAPPSSHRFDDTSATASSVLSLTGHTYDPSRVLDAKVHTVWTPRKAGGYGEWIQLSWPGLRTVSKIGAIVGYDKKNWDRRYSDHPDMWDRNYRLKAAELQIWTLTGKEVRQVEFDDIKTMQYRDFEPVENARAVRLIVRDVYSDRFASYGEKPWDDLAIAELQVWGYE